MKSITRARAESGWTLIELLAVISSIMILSAVALVSYRTTIRHAKEAALRLDLLLTRGAVDQYYADYGKYLESLDALVSESYLRTVPKDPFTESTTSWQTTEADAPPGTVSTTSPGIFEVKSGSQLTALDGSRYADW